MRRTATLLLLLVPVVAQAQIYGPEGINMVGQVQDPDWQNPPPQSGLVFSYESIAGTGTYRSGVLQAGNGGFEAGTNLEWLFTSGPSDDVYRNTWKDVTVSMNTPQTYTWQGSGNNTVTPVAGRYYVVRFLDNGYANTQAVWSELTAPPVTVSLGAPQFSGGNATVTVNLSAPTSSEQVYVRYSTDNYASSTVVAATCNGTATCTATVPTAGNPSYYAFTATGASTPTQSDAVVRTINSTSTATLPVELTTFTATVDGGTARLAWTTASETNNAGFYVEQRDAQRWREVGFVAGRGTQAEQASYAHAVPGLAPGRYAFRLRQVDFDGTATYSPTVEVTVGLDGAYTLEGRGAGLRLTVQASQAVRAEAFDVAGRRMAVLFDGPLGAGAATALVLPEALPAGAYVVRVVGSAFAATHVLVKAH